MSVTVGGRPAVVRSIADDAIAFDVPDNASGPIVVDVRGIQATSPTAFGGLEPLRVGQFRPRRGEPGTLVRIRGSGFSSMPQQNVVTLAGVPQQVVAASERELRIRVVAAPSSPFEVQVHGASARTRRPFLVDNPPTITDFRPRSGPAGTLVSVLGAGFGTSERAIRASMAGRPMVVRSATDGVVLVEVPSGITRGRIALQVGTRGGAATDGDFVVEAGSRVAGLSPASGYVGTELVIRGEGFPRRRMVAEFAGATPVVVRRVSPVELRVTVPAGARSGAVTVRTGSELIQAGNFQVVSTPQGVAVTSVEPQCAFIGCTAVLHGYGFAPAISSHNRVRFRGEMVRVTASTPTTLHIVLPNINGNGRFEVTVRGSGEAQSPPFFIQLRR